MNRRSFLATVLGAAASIPLLSKVAHQPQPEPKADTLGQEEIAPLATSGYGYAYQFRRDNGAIYYSEPFLLKAWEPQKTVTPFVVTTRAYTTGSLDRIYA